MMQIEKALAATDLNKYKKEPIEKLMEQLYRYQNFKFETITDKIDFCGYNKGTVHNYFTTMRVYLRTNVKNKSMGCRIYNIIDNLVLKCYSTLTPSEEDRAVTRNRKSTPSPTPVKPVTPVEPLKLTEPIPPQYGVMCDNIIRILPTKDRCLGYIDCYKEISDGSPAKLVKIDFEIEE